jgi:CheY-like chemotaxis protein
VLLVDDLVANRDILARQLNRMGLQVTSADTAAQALELMNVQINVVITDRNLPNMDGLKLARALRHNWRDVPILLLTSDPADHKDASVAEIFNGVLQKPVPRGGIFAALSALQNRNPPSTSIEASQTRQPDAASATPSAQHLAPLTCNMRRMRVLAAEDNRTNQLVFRKMVKELDIDLKFAGNGLEAVELYQSFQPDLIFMDISMPKMDGKEATQEIRRIEAQTGAHVQIVALTAHAMDGDSEGILASGLDHYLTKPLRKALIHEKIRAYRPTDAAPLESALEKAI